MDICSLTLFLLLIDSGNYRGMVSLPFRSGLFGSIRTREIILYQEGRQRELAEIRHFREAGEKCFGGDFG